MNFVNNISRIIYRLTGRTFVKLPPLQHSSELKRILNSDLKYELYGKWSDISLDRHSKSVEKIEGDFMEIGVAYGRTFHRLAKIASLQGKTAHAVDSFAGMAEPGEYDRPDVHGKGKFAVGGASGFIHLMNQENLPRAAYKIWEGYVPKVFSQIPSDIVYSLALVDLDHYAPTRDSLAWVWPRLSAGGYLLLDDCGFYWDMESTRAIKEFLSETTGYWIVKYDNNQLILRKASEPLN